MTLARALRPLRPVRLCRCIACGCDDLHACWDERSQQPCSWLRLSLAQRLGVCSACPEHLPRWDAGDRAIAVPTGEATP